MSATTLLARWIEELKAEGIAADAEMGTCGETNYHPKDPVTRDAMAKFLRLAIHGSSFSPEAATGAMFCDVSEMTLLAKWMEQLRRDNVYERVRSGCVRKGRLLSDERGEPRGNGQVPVERLRAPALRAVAGGGSGRH